MTLKLIKNKLNSLQRRPYLLSLTAITITALAILTYLIFDEYYTKHTKLKGKIASDIERIEHSFEDIIKHTEFVMKVIISQIKQDPKNLHHIENIINKYSINPHLTNVLSWTSFSWLDDTGVKLLDSTSGKNQTGTNLAAMSYIVASKEYPGQIQIGEATFSQSTQRYILPASVGATSNNSKYLGSLTVGFDLNNLSDELGDKIKDPDTSFAILNHNFDIVSQFNNASQNKNNQISNRKLHKFITQNNITFDKLENFSEINLLLNSNSIYIKKIPNYPFAIYMKYHSEYFTQSLYKDLVFRVIEVTILAAVSLFIIFIVYKRENALREKAEQSRSTAIQALKSKNDFLAYTAHELRSPISFMISSSEIMMSQLFGPIPEKYLEYIQNMNQSGKELLTFIEDLLENMKLQQSHFTIQESSVDIRSLLLRAIKINTINYDDKITIETYFQKTLPKVISDEKRLLQIFNNIISNATKYSPSNSTLKIEIRMHKKEIFINFHDSGYGMSEEGLQKSMYEFEIAHDIGLQAPNIKSVGLGLPLIKSLLELMGLRFFIDSKLGVGTAITIVFPPNKIEKSYHEPTDQRKVPSLS
jgi:signal transduction histidine kinase